MFCHSLLSVTEVLANIVYPKTVNALIPYWWRLWQMLNTKYL